MDWRAISRSRSRISMDWRPTSRSRSRPPPGQPFDQGNYSNSWSEGKFTYPPFGELTPLPGPISGLSRSLDASVIPPNEHATSSSIPIPGIATQLRYGSPPLSSSLHSHSLHLAAVYEETAGLSTHFMPYSEDSVQVGQSSRFSHPDPFHPPLSTLNSPSTFHPSSLPSSFGPLRNRQEGANSQPGNLARQLGKASLGPAANSSDSNAQSDIFDPILVRILAISVYYITCMLSVLSLFFCDSCFIIGETSSGYTTR